MFKTKPYRLAAEIVSDPTVMGGEPVNRGTRIHAATIAAYLDGERTSTIPLIFRLQAQP